MSTRTITKFTLFVITICGSAMFVASCFGVFSRSEKPPDLSDANAVFDKPQVIAKLQSPEVTESSGLAVSKCQTDVFWTHNDSGDGPLLYAFDSAGKPLGTWRVTGAKNTDWEDLAMVKTTSDECFLYIGEIGNNARRRPTAAVYRVREPKVMPESSSSSRKQPENTDAAEMMRFSYSSSQDAETLMVHPQTGVMYVLTKNFSGPSAVYKIEPRFDSDEIQKLESIATITVPAVPQGLLTGGDISPDGRHVIICDYYAAYELTLEPNSSNFDEIWKAEPKPIDIGKRDIGESIAYGTDAKTIYATSERKNSPLIMVQRK